MTLDIVIPVLNEEGRIQEALSSLKRSIDSLISAHSDAAVEVWVVDGGSIDGTIDEAKRAGAGVVACSERGRGNQIAEGAEQGAGDWLLILHADAQVEPDALSRLAATIRSNPKLVWGILGHRYDESGLGLWLTSVFNRLRFDLLGLGYGDQGMFVKRSALGIAGIPRQPLMEDVELSRSLHGQPRACVGRCLIVSTRRWREKGFWRYTFGNLRLVRGYLHRRRAGEPAESIAEEMYEVYYGG